MKCQQERDYLLSKRRYFFNLEFKKNLAFHISPRWHFLSKLKKIVLGGSIRIFSSGVGFLGDIPAGHGERLPISCCVCSSFRCGHVVVGISQAAAESRASRFPYWTVPQVKLEAFFSPTWIGTVALGFFSILPLIFLGSWKIQSSIMVLTCRFYEQRYPEMEDVVMVNVRSIEDMGAYVHLLEYNNIEGKILWVKSFTVPWRGHWAPATLFPGMILLSELSRRRIRSINKLIRVGRTEPVVVIRVDKDKGYIDLSKRRVSREDIERCVEQVSKAKVSDEKIENSKKRLPLKSAAISRQQAVAMKVEARYNWPEYFFFSLVFFSRFSFKVLIWAVNARKIIVNLN